MLSLNITQTFEKKVCANCSKKSDFMAFILYALHDFDTWGN